METISVLISDLRSFKYQPKERTTERAIDPLKKSIQEKGLFMPILVDSDNNIIDGHRRVECYKALGKNKIDAIRYSGDIKAIDVFSDINTSQRKMKANEMLKVCISGGTVSHKPFNACLQFCVDELGRGYLQKLYDNGLSPYYVKRVHGVAQRCMMGNGSKFKRFIDWAIKHSAFSELMTIDKLKLPVESLKKNIVADKGLKRRISYR